MLKQLIKEAANIVAFTGAGISTESGIPDFRSAGGLYKSGEFEGMEPEDILSRRTLRTNTELLVKFYKHRLLKMLDKEPNRAHKALVKLENDNKLKAIVTQNIDNLHKKAGSKNVYELHGNSTRFRCTLECNDHIFTYDDFQSLTKNTNLPRCPKCTFGIIRPDVVLFDEWLDDEIFIHAQHAIKQADLLITIGSSLQVMPACSLLHDKRKECKLVIINNDSTPFDKFATLIIKESCGQVLEEAVDY